MAISSTESRPRQITNLAVGHQRTNRRIWIEGKRLADVGFVPGARYLVDLDGNDRQLVLKTDGRGERIVSGRKDQSTGCVVPIIDLCNAGISTHLGRMSNPARVRVTFEDGRICITIHEIIENARTRERTLKQCIEKRKVTEGVAFVGGGISAWALAQGLEDKGYRTRCAWILDREHRYLESALRNIPAITDDTTVFEAAVEEIDARDLSPVDILSASLPCVGYSVSGMSKKHLSVPEEDESGTAFVGLIAIIRSVNPSILVHENVPAFANSATRHVLVRYLEKLGYRVQERVLGRELGAFERRDRHILIAVSRGLAAHFDMDRIQPSMTAPRRLRDILDPVPSDSHRWKSYSYLEAKESRDAADGKGFRRQLLADDAAECGVIGRGYMKARSTEPFLTHPTDPSLSRLLTPAEHARAKGIPESAVAGLSETLAHEVLGQSVLFPVFRSIGRFLGASFDAIQTCHAPVQGALTLGA